MKYCITTSISRLGKTLINSVFLSLIFLGSNIVNAASMPITAGSEMTVIGAYTEYLTSITLNSVIASSATGDLASTLPSATPPITGTINGDGKVFINPFVAKADVFEIGGWHLDLSSLSITPSDTLTMDGTGILYGNSFDPTAVTWSFSGGSVYSMTITAVPVPAAVWLFGSGLIGLIGIARRKTA